MLGYVSNHLDNQGVLEGEGPLHQKSQPIGFADQLGISLVCRQVYRQGHHLKVHLLTGLYIMMAKNYKSPTESLSCFVGLLILQYKIPLFRKYPHTDKGGGWPENIPLPVHLGTGE